ncbi:NAD-dependent epimerase/dehydratase family protein [Nesterenkonia sp. NBAIMH1]|uniref:NAD-dependent epimerase/dehydratase family protein n=1 Tax=Nesterenkonia sp. NBAIMH1 TaxID=2600320 RepID=UPI0011B530F8|nr:NAD-dependent epimerase/dehydratase family protein [Nesterenkonia sp. NBAIMH1]
MTARTSPLQHVLLAGCGDLGERVGTLLHAQGTPVTGIRRRPKPHGLPFPVLGMDLAEPDRRHELPAADAVVIAMTADEPTHEGYERAYRQTLAGLASILPRPLPRLVFVSSTGVLGDWDGDTVTEQTPPSPKRATAKVLHSAESDAYAQFPEVTVVRPAGIYGPGRTRTIDRVRAGKPADHGRITNRIHSDDLASAIVTLLELEEPPSLVHAVDRAPSTMGEVLTYVAARLGVPVPEDSGNGTLSGKTIDASLLHSLLPRDGLRYPTFREGYGALIDAAEAERG